MKNVYVCEKCGAQYDQYDEAYACENGHLRFSDDFNVELDTRKVWKKQMQLPNECVLCVDQEAWSTEEQRYIHSYTFGRYKLVKELEATETESILSERALRKEKEDREYKEWCEKEERRLHERKAEAEAKAKAEAAAKEAYEAAE